MILPVARQLDFSEIPVINIAPLIKGTDFDVTINQLRDACERVGFFYVSHHGVDANIVSALHNQAKLFFTLPVERKKSLLIDHTMRGYLPLYYRSYEGEDRAGTSHQEGFWIGHDVEPTAQRPLDELNRWPEELSAFKSTMESYFAAVEKLSLQLARGFALALGLDQTTLLPLFVKPTSRLKLNHYPPQKNPSDEHNIGVVPHTDSGAFTILWQDNHGGLEVQNKQGNWVGAPPIENTFVVNLGNMMPIWSSGRFASTPHRVINRSGNERYSIPLFVNPNHDVIIEPLVEGSTYEGDRFVYGEYQSELWRKTFPIAKIPQL